MDTKQIILMVLIPLAATTLPYFAARSESAAVGLVLPFVVGSVLFAVGLYLPGDELAIHRKIAFYFLAVMFFLTIAQRMVYNRRRTGQWKFTW